MGRARGEALALMPTFLPAMHTPAGRKIPPEGVYSSYTDLAGLTRVKILKAR
jgi:hypothetical protein